MNDETKEYYRRQFFDFCRDRTVAGQAFSDFIERVEAIESRFSGGEMLVLDPLKENEE